jgi:hypothetical protein
MSTSIATLGELKADIADTMNRTDLTVQIPRFIRLCHVDIQSRFSTNEMEKNATWTMTANDPEFTLPADYHAMRRLEYSAGAGDVREVTLGPFSPISVAQSLAQTGYPRLYSVRGDGDGDTTIILKGHLTPTPSTTFTGTIYYYRSCPIFDFTDDDDTNWILTEYPTVWLYGALLSSLPKIGNDSRSQMWATYYEQGLDNIISSDKNKRFNKAPELRSALMS